MCRFTSVSVLLIFSPFTLVLSVTALGSSKRLVRHTSAATWIQANATCHHTAHRLIVLDSYTRHCLRHAARTAHREVASPPSTPPCPDRDWCVQGVDRVWIGMYKQHVAGAAGEGEVFRWTDCTPVSKWAVTDLVNTHNTGSCVGARGPSLLWAAYKCQNLFSFICESSVPLRQETPKCTYYPQTLSCVWDDARFVHHPTASCKATCLKALRCWGFIPGTFTATAGAFRHDPTAPGCTLVTAETLRTCRPALGGSYYMVLKLCYWYESVTTKPEDVKDLPAVPANTCSAKDLTSSTTHPTTAEWSLRTSTSDEGTAISATATKEQRSDTRKTNTSLTAEAETSAALTPEATDSTPPTSEAAQPNTPPTSEAAQPNTPPASEAAQPNTPPASEAAQPNTPPADRAETNAWAPAPAAGTNTPPSPGALQPTAPATAEAHSATSATRAAATTTDTRPPSGVGPSGPPMAESDRSDQSTSEANDASPPTMQEQPATDLSSQWKASTAGHSPPKHAAGPSSGAVDQSPSATARPCSCTCSALATKTRAAQRVNVSQSLRTLKKSLQVVTTNLSATRRRKESAPDSRPSARGAAAVSIFVVAAVGMVIVLPDLKTAAVAVLQLFLSRSKRPFRFRV